MVYRVDIQRGSLEHMALDDPLRVACIENGRSIIYVGGSLIAGQSTRIARRDLETGAETELFSGRTIGHVLQRSADETRTGFIEVDGDSARIVIMPSTGGDPTFTFAFERHAGTAVQDWAIENLLRFIQSGETWTSVMPVLPR